MSWLFALHEPWFPSLVEFPVNQTPQPQCCCQYIFLLEINRSLSPALKPLDAQLLLTGVIRNSFHRHIQPFTIWPQPNSLLFFLPTVIRCPTFQLQFISQHFLKQQCPSLYLYPNCFFCLKMFFACYNLINTCMPLHLLGGCAASPGTSLSTRRELITLSGLLSLLCTSPLYHSLNKSHLCSAEGQGSTFPLLNPSSNRRAWHLYVLSGRTVFQVCRL